MDKSSNPFLKKPLSKVTKPAATNAPPPENNKDKPQPRPSNATSTSSNGVNIKRVDNNPSPNADLNKNPPNKNNPKLTTNNNEMYNNISENIVNAYANNDNEKKGFSNLKKAKASEIIFEKDPAEEQKLTFYNDEQVIAYIKARVKDGKIKDIYQKLEIARNDFTGFVLSKKNHGYTIYEIEVETDLDKVNESFRKQRVEVNNKQVQFIYLDELSKYKKLPKEPTVAQNLNQKKPIPASASTNEKKPNPLPKQEKKYQPPPPKENLQKAMMRNKILESEKPNVDKANNDIKNMQNKIHKYKQELRNGSNISDVEVSRRVSRMMNLETNASRRVSKMTATNLVTKDNTIDLDMDDTQKMYMAKMKELNNLNNKKLEPSAKNNEDDQKKMNRALQRFRKAYSQQKDREDEKKVANRSTKIEGIAGMLEKYIRTSSVDDANKVQIQYEEEPPITNLNVISNVNDPPPEQKSALDPKKNFKKPKMNFA